MIIIAVLEIGGQQRDGECAHIQQEVQPFAGISKQLNKTILHKAAEQVQRKHVEEQVSEIGMDQSATEKTVPLFPPRYSRRIKDQVVNDLLVVKTANRNKD